MGSRGGGELVGAVSTMDQPIGSSPRSATGMCLPERTMSGAKTRHMAWGRLVFSVSRWPVVGADFGRGILQRVARRNASSRIASPGSSLAPRHGAVLLEVRQIHHRRRPQPTATASHPHNSARRQGEGTGRVRSSTGAPRPAMQRGQRRRASALLERHLSKAPELAAMQMIGARFPHQLDGADADQQVLVDAFSVEVVGHAG